MKRRLVAQKREEEEISTKQAIYRMGHQLSPGKADELFDITSSLQIRLNVDNHIV
jgi:hypothetical protein